MPVVNSCQELSVAELTILVRVRSIDHLVYFISLQGEALLNLHHVVSDLLFLEVAVIVFVPLNEEIAKLVDVLRASHHVCDNGADTRLEAGGLAEGG